MKHRSIIFLLAAVLLVCACNNPAAQFREPALAVDSVYYAEGFKISYHSDYITVDLRDPWDTLKLRKRYILAEKELLEGNDSLAASLSLLGLLVPVPVERAVIYTSVHTSMAEQLGCLDKVVGVCEPEYITSETVKRKVASGEIADIGIYSAPNVEKMIELNTEIIIASPFENSGYGAAEKLGIPIVEAADYMEEHPLGRAEWVRFYGLLFGCREKADEVFFNTMEKYDALKALTQSLSSNQRPTFILERRYGATWFIPSQKSYIGCLHADAGADYIFKDNVQTGSMPMSFESVLEKGIDAKYWFIKYGAEKDMTYADLESEYQPYSNFAAFKNRNIYCCNTLSSTYYDDITLHPDQVLADLIHIYHPELLLDHIPKYYRKMGE
ncbi:MAG: ABC transporter substrate-binding protein [Bacteroidales bacterium]|nr:ABC transporter substrate-binding protein [Bacteroidales bacterium]